MLFVLIVPLYGRLASRVNRLRLIGWVTAFFISNLVIFFALGQMGVPIGIAFFLWVGLFNLLLVAQFWAFANDVYSPQKGERLFGIVGIGSSLGAILGALVAGWLFDPIGPYAMMLCAALLLALAMILTVTIHRREQEPANVKTEKKSDNASRPLGPEGGFRLIFKHRYLVLIAVLVMVSNFVNTTGEFILGKTVEVTAQSSVGAAGSEAEQNFIGEFYSSFFFWVNLLGAILQMFLVSRLMQHLGIGMALFFLPLIALGGYMMLIFFPLLNYIRVAKILENSTDYSVQNTARHALFLPTSREAKYKAKAAIDGFFWRAGDTLSGVLVFVGSQLALGVQGFAAINVVLVLLWLGIAGAIVRHLKKTPTETRVAA
jgi:AAA family ATP:ADP antiporter